MKNFMRTVLTITHVLKPGTSVIVLFVAFTFGAKASCQVIPFDSDRWQFTARTSKVVDYLGRRSLYLSEGLAVVKDSSLTNGVVEFDIAFPQERAYVGAVWRLQDLENYENFYLRPHQSGNPDANQYQPVFNGMEAWQLYYGQGYGAPVKYDFNQWFHVKIVVSGKQAEVYIKDMEVPALFINDLMRDIKAGKVGLSAGSDGPAHVSNFSFTPMENPPLKTRAKAAAPAPAGTVMSWLVSNTFDGKGLEGQYQLSAADKQKLSWSKIECESGGLANLARLHGLAAEKNTVFARLTIQSDREQLKKLTFSFSDEVKVYFNDRLLYGGHDVYRSRDYRFLGTIGMFDEVYLALRKGENEVWFAVSENFGGWGVEAAFENLDGIRMENHE